jgi:hypothetical protein
MRRFLFSGSFLSAVLTGLGLLIKTLTGPRDWRILLLWATWLMSLILTVSAINERRNR